MYCMECGGKLVLNENGELVCSVCGLVHVENRIREESYILANRITAQGYTPAPLE
ncbi:MAG TPA: hypothetical protein ENF87_00095, partial [Thermoproteales archaeon]|nr:hypothetical protein [Thermoproteales archaeon]